MSGNYRDINQDDKRQADLSAWRKSWSPVISRVANLAEVRPSFIDARPRSDVLGAIAYSMPLLLVRSLDTSAGSINRVAAAAAYAEMGE